MKTTFENIGFGIITLVAIITAIPNAIISSILKRIEHESDEVYYRRCYWSMRWYLGKICSEDEFVQRALSFEESRSKK